MFQIAQGITANAIVRRNGTQIKVPETPIANDDATSKKYVDDTISSSVSSEATLRESADSSLQTQINTLSTDLQTEVTNRTNADTTLQENIDTKVSKIDNTTTYTQAYTVTTGNTQSSMIISSEVAGTSLVQRDTAGRFKVAAPIYDSQATNKKYVDDADTGLQNQITSLDTAINRDVVTNTDFTYSENNVTSTHTKTNLKTGATSQETHTFNLANSTTAGLMSKEDVQALSDLQARVGNLENKTTRLLFTGQDANATTINTFVTGLGYTSPFEGIAVVVEMADGTHHIWHYYSNDNIGWKDDGIDTVNLFTNTTAGIVKGSTGTAGKIFAENDGTASVIGWDNLTNKVNDNSTNIGNIQTSLANYATTTKLNEEVERATGVEEDLQEQIDGIEETVGEINTQVGTNTTDISNLKTNKADSSSLNNYLPLVAGSDKKLTGDLYFDTSTSDRKVVFSTGAVVKGTSAGSLILGSKAGSPLYLSANGETPTDNTVEIYTTLVAPRKDNLMYLGTSSNQWKAVYGKSVHGGTLYGGTIYGDIIYQKNEEDKYVQVANKEDLIPYATKD